PGATQPSCECVVNARANDDLIAVGPLIDDLASAVYLGKQFSIGRREAYLGERPARANGRAERAPQRFQSTLVHSGHEHRVLHEPTDPLLQRQQFLLAQKTDLVE